MAAKKFYIGERSNPQLNKPYYNKYGKLSKKDARAKENCSYGSMYLMEFETEEAFLLKIQELESEGFRLNDYLEDSKAIRLVDALKMGFDSNTLLLESKIKELKELKKSVSLQSTEQLIDTWVKRTKEAIKELKTI